MSHNEEAEAAKVAVQHSVSTLTTPHLRPPIQASNASGRTLDMPSVIELVADHFGLYGRMLEPTTDLVNDLDTDDIDRREVLLTAEEFFGVRLSTAQMDQIQSIEELYQAIRERKNS